MSVTDVTFGIDDTIQWHASQLEKINLLPVLSGNEMIGVGQPDKGDPFLGPVLLEGGQRIRSNGQDLSAAVPKFFIVVSQTRQLRAAVRSHEATQKGQHDRPPAVIRQAPTLALHIVQFEIRCKFPRCNQFRHRLSSFKNCAVASTICFC